MFRLDTLSHSHDHARMARTARGDQLLRRIDADGHVSVGALARDLGVTQSTIRRDLARLARDGRIVRTYGGAEVRGPVGMASVTDLRAAAKRRDRRGRSGPGP